MRRTLATFLLSSSLLSSPAMADHMTGTYQGTREIAGTTLQLTQTNNSLSGKFTGKVNGTLTGITDGGDIATGQIQVSANEVYGYTARWSTPGFDMFVFTPNGAMAFTFVAGAGGTPPAGGPPGDGGDGGDQPAPPAPPAPPPPPAPPAPPPPPPPPPPEVRVDYYLLDSNRQPIGPFTLQEVAARLADGRANPSDLIWKDGLPGWVQISTLEEFQ
jgi:hypothetical protein